MIYFVENIAQCCKCIKNFVCSEFITIIIHDQYSYTINIFILDQHFLFLRYNTTKKVITYIQLSHKLSHVLQFLSKAETEEAKCPFIINHFWDL